MSKKVLLIIQSTILFFIIIILSIYATKRFLMRGMEQNLTKEDKTVEMHGEKYGPE